jgi:hypothetical protein
MIATVLAALMAFSRQLEISKLSGEGNGMPRCLGILGFGAPVQHSATRKPTSSRITS